MKKFLSLFLCLTCVLTLVACGKKVAPITLPQTDEITSIDITFGENTVSHSDKTWISEIIADISSSEPTKKESVQDCPQVESYIKIDFQLCAQLRVCSQAGGNPVYPRFSQPDNSESWDDVGNGI